MDISKLVVPFHLQGEQWCAINQMINYPNKTWLPEDMLSLLVEKENHINRKLNHLV